jgi:hypothetical protein
MAQQIVKKHIGSGAIDGDKIQLLQGQALKILDSSSNVVELLKLDENNKALIKGQEVGFKSDLSQEISDRQAADATTLASAKVYSDQAIAALVNSAPSTLDTLKEIADQLAADQSVVGALTTTVANNLLEAKSYADTKDGEKLVEAKSYSDSQDALKLAEAKSYTDTQVSSGVMEAKTYADTVSNSALVDAKAYADTQDSAKLAEAKGYADTQDAAKLAEAKAYSESQDALKLAEAKSYADAGILVEKNRAQAAEGVLTTDVDGLRTRVTAVEGSYSGLVSDMDNLEGYAQDIRSDLDQELIDRANGDSALEARILSLETKKSYAHEKEMFTAAAPLISITLSKEAAEKSLVVFVGRLALHAGEDYLVSVVGGKTVLTWHGDFAVGGVEAIAVGDQIRVMYNYLV